MRPRLLDTDMIDIPVVGARALYSSIVPHDEGRYFRNALEDMDEFERHLVIISFPIVFLTFLFSLAFSFLFAHRIWNFVSTRCPGCRSSKRYESRVIS